jgi:phosphoglycolate phosphatase
MWVGEGLPTLCRRAVADAPHVPFDQMFAAVSAAYETHRLNQVTFYPGIPELLDDLVARGIRLAILSNKPHEHTLPMAEAMFSAWPFVAVQGYEREELRKPDPRTARDIVSRMGLPLAEAALVGDSDTDMRTAVNAGILPVGATWGYRDRETILAAGAQRLVGAPRDVLELLN